MKISTQAIPQSSLLELISPSGLLSIRGGSAEKVDSIYIRSAVGYFNNLRVPAAVLTSIIMKEMFTLQSTPTASMKKWDVEHGVAHSKRWRILRYSYLLLMVLAFSLETFTIFVATQVLTELATASALRMILDGGWMQQSTGWFECRNVIHKKALNLLLQPDSGLLFRSFSSEVNMAVIS